MSTLAPFKTQLTLADYVEAPRRKPVDAELTRVRGSIGRSVVDFCAARVGQTFHASELREHVARECGAAAPASADRILRALRADGVCVYTVVDRGASLYRVLAVSQ
jgi:hypothetical protein